MGDTYTVDREVGVDAPAPAVYERIVDFQRWPALSPYEELDPAMDRTSTGRRFWGRRHLRVSGQPQGRGQPDENRGRRRRRPGRDRPAQPQAVPVGEHPDVRARQLGRRHDRHVVHDGTDNARRADHGHLQVHGPDGRPLFEKGLPRLKDDAEAA